MTISQWKLRRWVVALGVAVLAAVVVGVPTGVISTPFYTRMTPVLWWNYPVWLATAILSGLIMATYVRSPLSAKAPTAGAWANLLSAFAVGCPVCNKLVVAIIGVSGALTLWAPVQPILAVGSLALLGWALVRRLRGERSCGVPAAATR
ncbi:hypothetical protein A5780_30675 [Nocardia sp. 852002-20019_SCH5090214]|uniref:Uncharacterized protein n=1 Tax=Nocardia africana TaxID=134964 RepID=A0A378X403_9NOCA|nr:MULTISPECIES: hypothetical protein [Nocardia]MCC3316765.1 hypothetical protein [Nocardia africana]OBA50963.1 hypothetical protein A5780_30675 [Nocardia sp. 852002-20019_SCH5090214]SUA47484.1 Uncharacterised protein [Nocardia africana]